jgi:hypothetical protein
LAVVLLALYVWSFLNVERLTSAQQQLLDNFRPLLFASIAGLFGGSIGVTIDRKPLAVAAGGALAVFVLTYLVPPAPGFQASGVALGPGTSPTG